MFSQAAIKSRFFANLAKFCKEGSSYPEVISHLQRSPDADVREWASWLAPKAHCGVGASLMWRPDLFNSLDRAIVSSGEDAGRLFEAFQYLSQYYIFLMRVGNRLYEGLLTPVLFLLGGTLILSIAESIVAGGTHSFWLHCGPPIFALGLGGAGIFLIARFGIQEAARNIHIDQFLRRLPMVGKAWQELTESRFALAFSLRIQAGMPILSALELSGKASQSAMIEQGTRQAAAASIEKSPMVLSKILKTQGFWSPRLLNMFPSENVASADGVFQISRTFQQSAIHQIEKVCNLIPKVISFLIWLLIVWKIFGLLVSIGDWLNRTNMALTKDVFSVF